LYAKRFGKKGEFVLQDLLGSCIPTNSFRRRAYLDWIQYYYEDLMENNFEKL